MSNIIINVVNDNLRSGKWNKVTLNTQFVRSVYSVSHQFS
ncbi:hypothetical protein Mpsy_2274 [Methanolobus psychrophilus R15]|nr:hypothetical protein Mpsy_2274 [Methanolobus psychrophilus R15]